jgi:DNA-binding transcriptional MocR family regulator
VAELIEEGELQRHVRRMRRVYQARRDAMLAALERHLPGVLVASTPPGGMALWARAQGVDVDRWAARAARQGPYIWAARTFAFAHEPRPRSAASNARRTPLCCALHERGGARRSLIAGQFFPCSVRVQLAVAISFSGARLPRKTSRRVAA